MFVKLMITLMLQLEKCWAHDHKNFVKTESTKKSSNICWSWTKIKYQNNLNPIALFPTLNKR